MNKIEQLAEIMKDAAHANRQLDCYLWLVLGKNLGGTGLDEKGNNVYGDPYKGIRLKPSCVRNGMTMTEAFSKMMEISPLEINRLADDYGVPFFTRSLDDVQLLMREGWEWLRKDPNSMTVYQPPEDQKEWAVHYEAPGKSPPLALISAILCSTMFDDLENKDQA